MRIKSVIRIKINNKNDNNNDKISIALIKLLLVKRHHKRFNDDNLIINCMYNVFQNKTNIAVHLNVRIKKKKNQTKS